MPTVPRRELVLDRVDRVEPRALLERELRVPRDPPEERDPLGEREPLEEREPLDERVDLAPLDELPLVLRRLEPLPEPDLPLLA